MKKFANYLGIFLFLTCFSLNGCAQRENSKPDYIQLLKEYTGIETNDTLKLIDSYAELLSKKDSNPRMGDEEINILFPKDKNGEYIYGLYDYLVENSTKNDYKSYAIVFSQLYKKDNATAPIEIEKKIASSYQKLGLIK